jgi:DNA-binding beta-propeller fold protein YncE
LEGVTIGLFDRSGKNLATLTAQAKGVGHAYFTPNGRYALITQYNDTVLPVLDLEKRAIVANLDAGAGGHLGHAVFTADSRKAYVSNRKSDEVVVVDLERMAIAKRIQTAPSGQAQGQVVNGFYNVFERVVNPNLAS